MFYMLTETLVISMTNKSAFQFFCNMTLNILQELNAAFNILIIENLLIELQSVFLH